MRHGRGAAHDSPAGSGLFIRAVVGRLAVAQSLLPRALPSRTRFPAPVQASTADLQRTYAADGSWTASNLLGAPAGTTATNVSIAIDMSRSIAHVTVAANGQLFHRIRNTDGTWTPWGQLGNPGTASALSTTVDPTQTLHLTATY
jgi:hypothetical protein